MFIAALFTIAKRGSNPSVHMDGHFKTFKMEGILTHSNVDEP